MIRTNYHTHTQFCDGKNTAEEMVLAAIKNDIKILGFSSHAMLPFSDDWHIPAKEYGTYTAEIDRLKGKYADQIKIYRGFEADFINGFTEPTFENYSEHKPDYLIGSVHFVPGKEGYYEADGKEEGVDSAIEKYFNGSVKKAVQEYFWCERQMVRKCDFTFMGHPDVIRKQNVKRNFFDENEGWYKKELKCLVSEIVKAGVCVELNTGSMLRIGAKEPYPSLYLLDLLIEKKVPLTINSDAHTTNGICWWFDEALAYIKKAGCTELAFYEDGLKFQKI